MGRVSVTRIAGMVALAATVLVSVVPAGAQEAAPPPEAAAAAGPTRCTQRQVDAGFLRYFGVTDQALSAHGDRLAYDSFELVGDYYVPDHERVHLFDTTTRARTTLTSPLYNDASFPRLSLDGDTVVFRADPVQDDPSVQGSGPNGQLRPGIGGEPEAAPEILIRPYGDEVFTYDVTTGTTQQVSPPGDGAESFPIAVSADGDRILYWAETDDSVYGSLGPYALRIYDRASETTAEIVPDIGYWGLVGSRAAFSPDGSRVAFASERDLVGQNPDGDLEVFLWEADGPVLRQITDTDADSRVISFTADGALLGLSSDADLGGLDDDGAGYLYDIASGTFARRSNLGPGGDVSEDGSHISTESSADPFGTNADRGPEYSLYDVAAGATSSVTETPHRDEYRFGRDIAPDGSALAYTTWGQRFMTSNRVVLATGCDPAPRPDARVAVEGGTSVGDDVYWARASARQKQVVVAPPRSTTRFTVELQNDRTATDVFRVDGDSDPVAGYRVRYLRGDVDITQQVEAGTYFTEPVAAGAAATLTVEVATAGRRATGPSVVVDLIARSWTNPIARDAVRAKVRLE